MPKPFVLGVEIEEGSLGKVMRRINALPGVVNIIMNFDARPKAAAKPNGSGQPRGTFEATGQQALAAILNGKPPMTTRQLRDAFEAQGRSPASIASVLHNMKTNGEIKMVDDGYTLTKVMRDRLRHRVANKAKKK
jgi:hypothetical protein